MTYENENAVQDLRASIRHAMEHRDTSQNIIRLLLLSALHRFGKRTVCKIVRDFHLN